MAVCPTRRYAAFAQRGERPTIAVFDVFTLKRRDDLTVPEGGMAREFVSLSFSPDSKFLAAQSGAPDWNLYVWAWEKAKTVAAIKSGVAKEGGGTASITSVQFSPTDVTLISVCGPTTYRLFRLSEGFLKPLPVTPATQKQLALTINCHCWVSGDRVVGGTASGDLLLFEQADYRATIPQQQPQGEEQTAITSIVPVAKGFVCGDASGKVHFYERSDDTSYFRRRGSCQLVGGGGRHQGAGLAHQQIAELGASGKSVRHLAVNPPETVVNAVLDSNEVRFLDFSAESSKLVANSALEGPLAQTCHAQGITGLDACLRKPLVVTSSLDHSIRVWNYKHNSVQLAKVFPEEAYAVAIHPMGQQILIATPEKLRFANLLLDDIQVFHEFLLKGCREVRFNSGGNMFAVVQGNNILIYSTYTMECLATFKGHAQRIRAICFSGDDSVLVSAGVDGAVIAWDMHKLRKVGDSLVTRAVQFSAVAANADATAIFAVGSDKALKEIVNSSVKAEYPSNDSAVVTCLAITGGQHQVLMAGTSQGSVRVYKQPLNGEFLEYYCHSGPVSRLRVSRDNNILFSAGEDGTLYALDIRDPAGKIHTLQELDFNDEVLVTRSILEEHEIALSEARMKLTERENEHDGQAKLADIAHAQVVRELNDRMAREAEAWRIKYDALAKEKARLEAQSASESKRAYEENQARTRDLEAQYQTKIVGESQRYSELANQKDELQAYFERELRKLRESSDAALAQQEASYAAKIAASEAEVARLREELQQTKDAHAEETKAMEEDADTEITESKRKLELALDNEVQSHIATKNAWEAQLKKAKATQRELEEQRAANSVLQAQIRTLSEQVQSLEKEREARAAELKEWDGTVREKDKRINELRRQTTELEKLKFVLDFKIQELNSQIEPLHSEITSQREQIRKMNEELNANHKKFSELSFELGTLQNKVAALVRESAGYRRKLAEQETTLERYRGDLQKLVQHIQDPVKLKEAVKALWAKFGSATEKGGDPNEEVRQEMARQRDHLEKAMESLQNKAGKEREAFAKENQRLIRENVSLIAEINALRRESKELRTTLKERNMSSAPPVMSTTSFGGGGGAGTSGAETQKLIAMQREELSKLRKRVADLEAAMAAQLRPYSHETLPPMPGSVDGRRPTAIPPGTAPADFAAGPGSFDDRAVPH